MLKNTLIAAAAVATAIGAHAQSSVTIFGIADAAMTRGTGSVSDKTALTSSGLSPSLIGFRGVEDLGADMRAGFWLDAAVTLDSGVGVATNTNNQASGAAPAVGGGQGLTFNRRSTLSLGGRWGELRLGRDYTPSYWNLARYDPFGNLGVGAAQPLFAITGITGVRASNSMQYLYGHAFNNTSMAGGNGVHASVMYYMGENVSGAATSKDGTGYSARAGFNAQKFTVAIAAGKTQYAAGDVHQANVGGSYDFGVVNLMAHIARDRNGAIHGRGLVLGAVVPAGPGRIRASYSTYETTAAGSPESKKIAIGYVYDLSKRTAVYGTLARVKNHGSAVSALGGALTAAGQGSSGLDLGIRHLF